MKCSRFCIPILAIAGVAALTTTITLAQSSKDTKPATKPTTPPATQHGDGAMPELPPGMSMEDMQACMEAATPGEMHYWLQQACGVWQGKTKMWMAPDTEPMKSECIANITSLMDGRFTKCEVNGDMPGMGPFNGFGVYGFDNVSGKFQSTWVDNMGTGMMVGTGELSADGKTLTWNFSYNCPITKKPTKMREIERRTGKDSYTLEMHGVQPHTGKEYKMMEIAFTRKPGTAATAAATGTR